MSIISLKFLAFIAVVSLIYFIAPKKIRWTILLISSYIYYFIASRKLTVYLIITTISVYVITMLLQKIDINLKIKCKNKEKNEKKELKNKAKRNKKLLVLLAILINFGILVFLKYCNFLSGNINRLLSIIKINSEIPLRKIVLPLGISYYTLQAIGYVIDIFRGKYEPEKNFGKLALFLSFFPQMIEGPIGNYDKLAPKLYAPNKFEYTRVKFGLQLMLWGFFKKNGNCRQSSIICK